MLILATLGWGSNTIAGRLAVDEINPMMLIFLRWGIVVVLIWSMSSKEIIANWNLVSQKLKWIFFGREIPSIPFDVSSVESKSKKSNYHQKNQFTTYCS